MTNRCLTLSLLVAGLLLLLPTPAHPCQCGVTGSDAEDYARASAVFVGRVERISRLEPWWQYTRRNTVLALYGWLSLENLPDWLSSEMARLPEQGRYGLLVTFRVTWYWKGVSGKTINVATGMWMGDCGYPFEIGREYRVWAYRETTQLLAKPSHLYTNRCTRTAESSSARFTEPPPDKIHDQSDNDLPPLRPIDPRMPSAYEVPNLWMPMVLASLTGLAIGWFAQRLPLRRLVQDVVACFAADVICIVAFGVLLPVFAEGAMFAEYAMFTESVITPAPLRSAASLTQTAVLFALCLALSPALGLAARFKPTARLSRHHSFVFGVLGGAYGVILPMLMYWMRGNP